MIIVKLYFYLFYLNIVDYFGIDCIDGNKKWMKFITVIIMESVIRMPCNRISCFKTHRAMGFPWIWVKDFSKSPKESKQGRPVFWVQSNVGVHQLWAK